MRTIYFYFTSVIATCFIDTYTKVMLRTQKQCYARKSNVTHAKVMLLVHTISILLTSRNSNSGGRILNNYKPEKKCHK